MRLKWTRIPNWPVFKRWSYHGPAFQPLEGVAMGNYAGTITFLFGLSLLARLRFVLFSRGIYVSVMTFGDPLQPIRVDTNEPELMATQRAVDNLNTAAGAAHVRGPLPEVVSWRREAAPGWYCGSPEQP
jgi:hypothetical protein